MQNSEEAKASVEPLLVNPAVCLKHEAKADHVDKLPINGDELREQTYKKFQQELPSGTAEAEICYRAGMHLYTLNDSPEYLFQAAELFKLSIEKADDLRGHDEAQYMRGKMLANGSIGTGVRRVDRKEAARLFTASALWGHKKSCNAVMYIAFIQKYEDIQQGQTSNESATENWIADLVSKDDADAIQEAHDIGVPLNTPFGTELACIAAKKGCAKVIATLKAAGVNLNAANADGLPPIYIAAKHGHAKVITALVDAGAMVDVSFPERLDLFPNTTPLCVAVSGGHLGVVEALLKESVGMQYPLELVVQNARENNTDKYQNIVRVLETYLLSSATGGNPEAQVMFASVCFQTKKYVEAREWFTRAADRGNLEGKYRLARMLHDGQGGPEDQPRFRRLLDEAVQAGHKNARFLLNKVNERIAQQCDRLESQRAQHKTPVQVASRVIEPKDTVEATEGVKKKTDAKKPTQKRTQSIIPKAIQQQTENVQKTISPKTLFSDAREKKVRALLDMRSKIDEAKKLLQESAGYIKLSSAILKQSLKNIALNKDRLLKLEANLSELKALEKDEGTIKIQEQLIDDLLELLKNCPGTQTDPELQKKLTAVEDKDKSKPIFTVSEFLELQQALGANESVSDELFTKEATVLEQKCELFFGGIEALIEKLKRVRDNMQKRKIEHCAFSICGLGEPQPVLPAEKMRKISDTVAEIDLKLRNLIKTEEKAEQEHVEKKPQQEQTFALQRLGHAQDACLRRVACGQRQRTLQHTSPMQEENERSRPAKLPKAVRKKMHEALRAANQAAKAERIAVYKQKEAAKQAQMLHDEQVATLVKIRTRVVEEGIWPVAVPADETETKMAQEEKVTAERPAPLFDASTLELYCALQRLHSIIDMITPTGGLCTIERRYAILQSFAYLNELVSVQHRHHGVQRVATCLRLAIFKQHKKIMGMVVEPQELLEMVNAWITFLETTKIKLVTEKPTEITHLENAKAILAKISLRLFSKVYKLGAGLSKEEFNVKKSCNAFEEMMNFRKQQCYGTDCGIRLISSKIENVPSSVKEGLQIVIDLSGDTWVVYYKNKHDCAVNSFTLICDENQRRLLAQWTSMLNDTVLDRNSSPDAEAVYKRIYAAVTLKEGCTHVGDDIIGFEAERFCWAITGAERHTLERAKAKDKNKYKRAADLLARFAPQAFRAEHLERGIDARHLMEQAGEARHCRPRACENKETKEQNEVIPVSGHESLLFSRGFQCSAYVAAAVVPSAEPVSHENVRLPTAFVEVEAAVVGHSGAEAMQRPKASHHKAKGS